MNMNVQQLNEPFKLLLLALFGFLLAGCQGRSLSFAETITTELAFSDELQTALNSALEATDVHGASAAVIVEGDGMWAGATGESYPGRPTTPDMLFDTGSAGKMLMGPLMVKLAEDGLIGLDDPISKYLPDFPYADGSITIRQLLNHTSGLYMVVNHPEGPFRQPYAQIDHEKWWTIDEIFTTLGGESTHEPGEAYCYTQAGYQIATLIVEAVTGSTAAEQIQTRLLDPLNINDMLLDFSKPVPDQVELAHPWVDIDFDGNYEDVNDQSRNWIASLSRIYYYATPTDFAIWGHALFTGEVLNQSSMDEMLDFYRTDDWCGDDFFLTGYGLGVMEFTPTLTHGEPAWGHLGSIPGYRAYLAHLHQQGITIAIMANTDTNDLLPFIDGLLAEILVQTGNVAEVEPPLQLNVVTMQPPDVPIVQATSKEALFCQQTPHYEVEATPEAWINISLDWIVGTDEARAEEAWQHFTPHTITVNGQSIEIPGESIYGPEPYSVDCPDDTIEVWSKGLSLYLPPLPEGTYEIIWYSEVHEPFNNGFTDYKAGNYMELTTELAVK